MKATLKNIQTQLMTIPELKYVDENWGQLGNYNPNPPIQFPFALIDITALNFSNIGIDKTAVPMNRQMAEGKITITIGALKLTNTSGRTPTTMKDQAWEVWELIEKVHRQLQGFCPTQNNGALVRTGLQRVLREDGIQQYNVTYNVGISNV